MPFVADANISSLGYLWFHVSCNAMQGTWRSTRDMRGKIYIFFSIKVEIGGAKVQVTGQIIGHRSQVRSQVTHKNYRTLDKTVLDWRFTIQKQDA